MSAFITSTPADALVVGGGMAGSTLARTLARAGRTVVLLERSKGPHDKVCGEFLSLEALHYLRLHGVDVEAMGAVPVRRVRLFGRGSHAEAPLPFTAMSLSRRVLDEALLRAAEAAGVRVSRGVSVASLSAERGDWIARSREGDEFRARDAFLATGKHDLHGLPRPAGRHSGSAGRHSGPAGRPSGLVAFKMYFRLQPTQHARLADAVELSLFAGGYAGLQPVDGGLANLSLLIGAEHLRAVGEGWSGLLRYLLASSAHLAERLEQAEPLLAAPMALSSIPYGFLHSGSAPSGSARSGSARIGSAQDGSPGGGLWRVGDQAAVIPSFSGDGMAIALHSAALAARGFLRGDPPAAYHRELARQLRSGMLLAGTLSHLLVRRPWAAGTVQLWPGLLAHFASITRIPQAALLQAV